MLNTSWLPQHHASSIRWEDMKTWGHSSLILTMLLMSGPTFDSFYHRLKGTFLLCHKCTTLLCYDVFQSAGSIATKIVIMEKILSESFTIWCFPAIWLHPKLSQKRNAKVLDYFNSVCCSSFFAECMYTIFRRS